MPAIASIMAFQDINPVVITDDDKTGKEMKEAVIRIGDNFKEVFTIRDLNGNIIDNGTIEDTLPKDFVESTINKVLNQSKIDEISLTEISTFCEQLSLHLNQKIAEEATTKKDKKQKIDDILAKVKTKIAEYDEKSITEEKAPKLYQLADAILVKLGIKK
ncbi:MAG: hypothetical protein LBI63_06475 [Candidatus Ancillula sp.]|nr:hypothetical protein [Candidatus Ancillula sp.]